METATVVRVKRRAPLEGRELGWYVHLVHNRSVVGSLATLVHVPFMLAFLSVVVFGAFSSSTLDPVVLGLSLLVVGLLLYGEHMLDDMVRVGKPWRTVFSDRALASLATTMFVAAVLVGLTASLYYSTPLPFVGVVAGVFFCSLYGLEVWKFHEVAFGAIGYGAIPPVAYLAQSAVTGSAVSDPIIPLLLLAVGTLLGYVMLELYERTKTEKHHLMWSLLAIHLVVIYSIAGVIVWVHI